MHRGKNGEPGSCKNLSRKFSRLPYADCVPAYGIRECFCTGRFPTPFDHIATMGRDATPLSTSRCPKLLCRFLISMTGADSVTHPRQYAALCMLCVVAGIQHQGRKPGPMQDANDKSTVRIRKIVRSFRPKPRVTRYTTHGIMPRPCPGGPLRLQPLQRGRAGQVCGPGMKGICRLIPSQRRHAPPRCIGVLPLSSCALMSAPWFNAWQSIASTASFSAESSRWNPARFHPSHPRHR